MALTKKKYSTEDTDILGTFKPKVTEAVNNTKSKVSDFIDGAKETAQAVGEAVPGVTNLGQSLKSYANMNNYANDQAKAQANLERLEASEPGKYQESQQLTDMRGQLSDIESQKPGKFNDEYKERIDEILDRMSNQKPFSYDYSTDPTWQTLSDQYKRNAILAMENAMGDASGLTGGYASSWSQAAGQQAYQQEISQMTDIIPELADNALGRWQANNQQLASNLAALQSQRSADLDKYYTDWQMWNTDRNYMYQKVKDMSDDEFNKYLYELNRWQTDRAYYSEQKQIAIQNQQWQQELNESRRQFNQQMLFNYVNLGVGAAVDLTTAGMSAGVQLAGIGVDAALGAANLAEDRRQYDASLAEDQRQYDANMEFNEKWNQKDYDLAMAQLAEEKRQFDGELGYKYSAQNAKSSGGSSSGGSSSGNNGNNKISEKEAMSGIPEDLRLYLKTSDKYADANESRYKAIITVLDRGDIDEKKATQLLDYYGIEH